MLGEIDFDDLKIYVSHTHINMWKSFDGLAVLVQESLDRPPRAGELFIFYNKKKNKIKMLFWDGSGFVIYYKRFEYSKFAIERYIQSDGSLCITARALRELLVGANMKRGRLKSWATFEGKFVV